MSDGKPKDGQDDGFEQRANVRWDNDFGPATPMWQRYLMAGGAVLVVLGFLGAVILFGQADGARTLTGWQWIVFGTLLLAIVVVALRAEHWALWLKAKWFPDATDGDEDVRDGTSRRD